MSIFLEVLGQAEAKLKQMSQQMENIRWMAENGRYEPALEHALRLEYNSERLTLLTRALPGYTGNPLAKAHVDKAIKEAIPVDIGYTAEGWFCLRLPLLLPKKSQGSADYIRGCLYPAMRRFFQDKPPVRYSDCVLILRHVYSRDRPERQWRDHDNLEVNIVSDIVALYAMPDDMEMRDTTVQGEYFMMRSDDLRFDNVTLKGKYSFQYIEDSVFENCNFDTKDAFWHAKNVTVRNSTIKGEYLAWYCENVTFENCKIIGTQPLCYCKGLKLIDCEMIDTDLSFEKSEVEATLTAPIVSIKNPLSGHIYAPQVGEIIRDDKDSQGEIIVQCRCECA